MDTESTLPPNRFTIFKVSICSNQLKREPAHNLTLAEIAKYPYGELTDEKGKYFWSYCLTECWHTR